MKKRIIASFFSLVFTLLITAPTVISVLENSFDVSVFFSVAEEESKEKDSNKTIELIVLETKNEVSSLFFFEDTKITSYYSKNYNPFKVESNLPPPEFI